jgi:hypothetical protein
MTMARSSSRRPQHAADAGRQLGILGVAVDVEGPRSGRGFVTLAATLSTIPTIPVAGLALIIGIDRFMSEARALTNLIGNGVGTVVIAKWDGALNTRRMNRILDGKAPDDEEPERILVAEAHSPTRSSSHSPSERFRQPKIHTVIAIPRGRRRAPRYHLAGGAAMRSGCDRDDAPVPMTSSDRHRAPRSNHPSAAQREHRDVGPGEQYASRALTKLLALPIRQRPRTTCGFPRRTEAVRFATRQS